jgi:hypothetical protein
VVEWYASYTVGEGDRPPDPQAPVVVQSLGVQALDVLPPLGVVNIPTTWTMAEAEGTWDAIEAVEPTWDDMEVTVVAIQPSTNPGAVALKATSTLAVSASVTTPGTLSATSSLTVAVTSSTPPPPLVPDLPRPVFSGKVYPRVVQSGATNDVFFVDNIALYEDPIIWEFSNDDGDTWYPAYDIRNNPNGVLLFPDVVVDAPRDQESSSLRWRVWGFRPNLHITALLIRPWYAAMHLGMAPRIGIEYGGPNQSSYDQYPAIKDSPPFKAWSKPIPQDWWFFYRQWLLQQVEFGSEDVAETPFFLSDNLIYQ